MRTIILLSSFIIKKENYHSTKYIYDMLRKVCAFDKQTQEGPYQKPWDNYINISIGPIDVMKPFLKQINQAK